MSIVTLWMSIAQRWNRAWAWMTRSRDRRVEAPAESAPISRAPVNVTVQSRPKRTAATARTPLQGVARSDDAPRDPRKMADRPRRTIPKR